MSADLGDPGQDPQDPQDPQDAPDSPDHSPGHPHSHPPGHPHSHPPDHPHSHPYHHPHDLGERLPDLGPVEALLRADVEALPVPSGSFERIRRRATRRRRVRAATGGGLVAAVVVVGLYLLGVPGQLWDTAPPVAATSGGFGPTMSPTPMPSASASAGSPPGGTRSMPTPAPSVAGPTGGSAASGGSTAAPSSSALPTNPGGVGVPTGMPTIVTCATSQLTAALGGGDAGAGNLYRYLVLTNHGSTPCALAGFPGLSLLDARGTQLGASATFDHSFSYSQVVLQPGATASDTIHTLNAGATSCSGTSSKVRIYPPGNTASLVIPGQVMLCGGELSVSPFTSGSGGNPPS